MSFHSVYLLSENILDYIDSFLCSQLFCSFRMTRKHGIRISTNFSLAYSIRFEIFDFISSKKTQKKQ